MKCFFQLIDKQTGQRSPAVSSTRNEFAATLQKNYPNHGDEAYVLVLVDSVQLDVESEWNFSRAPLMTVSTFVKEYAPPISTVRIDSPVVNLQQHQGYTVKEIADVVSKLTPEVKKHG